MSPRILVVPASQLPASPSARLARLAAGALARAGAQVTTLSLADYALPLHDGESDEAPLPQNAILLAGRLAMQDGLLLVAPECNGSLSPLLLNALAWTALVRRAGDRPVAPFEGLIAGLAGTASGADGARGTLRHLCDILQALGAEVIAPRCHLAHDREVFETDGTLARDGDRAALEHLTDRLLDHARALARHAEDEPLHRRL